MDQALDGDGSTESALIVRKNRCFQTKTAVFMGVMALMDTICDGNTVVAREVCNHTLDFVTEGLWL